MGKTEAPDFDQLGVLAKKAQAGDGSAYETLLEHLYTFVTRVLTIRLGHAAAELDDLTQTCLLAMHRALPTYHPSRNLRPWVNAIIRYKLADHFRTLARQREFAQSEEILEIENTRHEDSYDSMGQVNIHELLLQLPSDWASAVRQTKLEGMTCEEAAKKAGISAAALRKRVSRAYKRLAELIEKELES